MSALQWAGAGGNGVPLMNQVQTGRADFGALLRMLRRRLPLIILAPVVALGVAYVIAKSEKKQYTGTAVLSFKPLLLDVQLTGLPLQVQASDPQTEASTDLGLVTVPQVRTIASRLLGSGYSPTYLKNNTSVAAQGKAQLLNVKGTAPTAAGSADVANAVATAFIQYHSGLIVGRIDSAISAIRRDLLAPGLTPLQKVALRNNLTKLTELKAVQPTDVALASLAQPPTSPSSPKTALDLIIGGIAGLLLGLALAIVAEQLDKRVRRPEEVEDTLNLPVLAMIPRSRVLRKGQSLSEADLEGFRLLRTNLRYRSGGRDVRSVLFTSAGPESGKTTVSLHLAAAAAAVMNGRVLLIEADLRRPRLAQMLGVTSERGLSTALAFSDSLADSVVTIHNTHGENGHEETGNGNGNGSGSVEIFPESFDVLPAGPPTPHASELLSSKHMSDLLRTASQSYDLTIVDGPPPGLVSDAIPLIKQVDSVVLVARLGREHSPELKKLQVQLRGLGVEPLGVVANFSRRSTNPYVATTRR